MPNFGLVCGAGPSTDFVALERWDYRAAAPHVRRLPYGRNYLRADYGWY